MTVAGSFWLIPALPLAAFALLAAGLNRVRGLDVLLAVAALAGSAIVSGTALLAAARGARATVSLPWLEPGGRALNLALRLDPLGAVAAALVCTVALLVFLYAGSYMASDPRRGRFFTVLALFAASMLALVLAADLLTLFIAWELVGFCSWFLIGFWFERPGAPAAAAKAFWTTRLADQALLAGVLLLVAAAGSGDLARVFAALEAGTLSGGLVVASAVLLAAGAAGKSAQLPFHGWLPDAMAGPTPVSALLHSATMVAAGVFLIARLYPLFLAAPSVMALIAWTGAATALLGGLAALVNPDLKRTLAYSTMSQLGLMFVALGSGSLLGGVLLLVAQALYKAPLFLAAGGIEHAVGSTAFARMGGLARKMPYTLAVFALASAALAGLPVTFALPAKDAALATAWSASPALFSAALAASLLTALYSARILGLVFFGARPRDGRDPHEAPPGLLAPMLAFAGLIVLGLLANAALLGHPLARLLGSPAPEAPAATAIALAIAAGGFALGLYARRQWPAALVWPPLARIAPALAAELGMKPLYAALARLCLRVSGALGALDRRIFDPLGARLAQTLSRFVGRVSAFDLSRVEATVDALGRSLVFASQRLRRLQTGRIENYLLAVFAWGAGVVAFALLAMLAS